MKNKLITTIIALFFIAVFVYVVRNEVKSAAPSGLKATISNSATTTVGPGLNTGTKIFNARFDCSSRIITTVAKPIMLSLGEVGTASSTIASTTVNGKFGHLQAASTTQAYDSGIYGCGEWWAYGFDASSTITTSEF